jgi:hypothetical protein
MTETEQERLTTRHRYMAWLGSLAPNEQQVVHKASEWWASVHALDMDALYALLEIIDQRITTLNGTQDLLTDKIDHLGERLAALEHNNDA